MGLKSEIGYNNTGNMQVIINV